jgi:hypothetical protein
MVGGWIFPEARWGQLGATFALAVGCVAWGQVPMPSSAPRLVGTDLAVLETAEVRKDLPCTVSPTKPALGFDLKFHSGYEVTVPLRELAGAENQLTVLFRVSPADRRDEPMYFSQRIRVPAIEEDAKGEAFLTGVFDLGEGNYHVDWLMRDRAERVCSFYWDTEAALQAKEKQIGVVLRPGQVARADGEDFKEEPPVERASTDAPLNVKLLVNFAPQNPNAKALRHSDTIALTSILRNLARHPHIGKFTVVAFNLQERRLLFRQDQAERIDFPALGKAVQGVNLGTVAVDQLANKNGDAEFLAELIRSELSSAERPDAIVFAGPKCLLDKNPSKEDLQAEGAVDFPVFYMNYNLNPQHQPWPDAISRAVKFYRGVEYTISRPRDLWNAVSEMVARIVKSKQSRTQVASTGGSQ